MIYCLLSTVHTFWTTLYSLHMKSLDNVLQMISFQCQHQILPQASDSTSTVTKSNRSHQPYFTWQENQKDTSQTKQPRQSGSASNI